jgi:hypothetical protein
LALAPVIEKAAKSDDRRLIRRCEAHPLEQPLLSEMQAVEPERDEQAA